MNKLSALNVRHHNAIETGKRRMFKTLETDATPKSLRHVILIHWVRPDEYRKRLICVGPEEDGATTRPITWNILPRGLTQDPTFDNVFDHFSENLGFSQEFTTFDRELECNLI